MNLLLALVVAGAVRCNGDPRTPILLTLGMGQAMRPVTESCLTKSWFSVAFTHADSGFTWTRGDRIEVVLKDGTAVQVIDEFAMGEFPRLRIIPLEGAHKTSDLFRLPKKNGDMATVLYISTRSGIERADIDSLRIRSNP